MSEIFSSGTDPSRLRALFTTAVWGRTYIDRFLDYSLRTQLSDGNLGAFGPDSLFLIITDSSDIEYITSSEAYRALSRLVPTECVGRNKLARSRSRDKYAKLTSCQNYALTRSEDYDAIFFGYGDALWAEGSYRAAARRIQEGYDAVFSFGYPVDGDRFVAAIDGFKSAPPGGAVAVSPRTFARHVYETLHSMAHANNWKNRDMGHCPSYVIWDVPGQGLLLRGFHYHPVAVRVRHDIPGFFAPFYSTLDEEFVTRLYRTHPRIYVCDNSDEMTVCSLAEENGAKFQRHPPQRLSVGGLAEFAEAYAGLAHRELFSHATRLVIHDIDEERWRPSQEEASSVAREVERRLMTPDCLLALEAPAAYAARWQRQANFGHLSPYTVKLQRKIAAINRSPGIIAPFGARRALRASARLLRALGLTPKIREHVLARLTPRQKQWLHRYLSTSAIEAPLIRAPRHVNPYYRTWGWWQWLWSWIRVHA